MKDELKSMGHNKVWDFIELLKGFKQVRCKWVFKTKCDSNGKVEWYKVKLNTTGYIKKYGFDYKETFSPSLKN